LCFCVCCICTARFTCWARFRTSRSLVTWLCVWFWAVRPAKCTIWCATSPADNAIDSNQCSTFWFFCYRIITILIKNTRQKLLLGWWGI
jgi:hypothetical protein